MPLLALHEPPALARAIADVVVVRNLFPAFTPAVEELDWLRQLVLRGNSKCRVLLYDYDPDTLLAPGLHSDDALFRQATALINDLLLDRKTEPEFKRAFIFICHGFGGLIVKRALILSESAREPTPWLRSVYLSTYAVLFAGTPHHGISKIALSILMDCSRLYATQFVIDLLSELAVSETPRLSPLLEGLCLQFEPLMAHIRVHNYWEQQQTQNGPTSAFIVECNSAAPDSGRTERRGLDAAHRGLLTVRNMDAEGFGHMIGTLKACVQDCHPAIESRWLADMVIPRGPSPHPIAHSRGHEFQHNMITGGRAHFGDNYNFYSIEKDDSKGTHFLSDIYLHKVWKVPRSSSIRFTGRELQLKILKEKLGQPGQAAGFDDQYASRVAIIYGLGGSGKTQFCIRYAEQNRQYYWGVFWIDASTRSNAEAGYSALGSEAGRGATCEAGKFWLSECTRPWLLVLDNADDSLLDLASILPGGAMGHTIITTRNRSIVEDFPHDCALQFGAMAPEEAIDLLLKSANMVSTTQQRVAASKLAAELGYLALALELAGTAIRKCYDSLESYLDTYLGYRQNLLLSSPFVEREEATAIASWDISFARMAANGDTDFKDAALLMSVFVFLHFESISTSIFRTAYLATGDVDKSLPGFFRLSSNSWVEANIRLKRGFRTLHNYSIVDYDTETQTCSIHPVVHRWARMRLADGGEFSQFFGYAMNILARCISPHLEASGQTFRRALLPHIDSCRTILEKRDQPFPSDSRTADVLEKFAAVYAETGNWKAALELQQKVVDYFRSTKGKWHHETLNARRKMSQIEWNRFAIAKAIDEQKNLLLTRWYARRCLRDWIPLWLPNHVEYCIALDDLTQSLWLAEELRLSKWTGQRALAGLAARLGLDDPLTLNAMLNLARTYHHLGELAEARKLLADVVRKRRRLFGPSHPDTLMARNEMGMVFLASQRVALAETIVANVYQARKRVLGAEHAYTLWSANDLAKVYYNRRDEASQNGPYIKASEAVKLLEGIVPIVIRTLKEEHVGMHMTRGNLAKAYARCHRWDKSESVLTNMLGFIDDGHPNWIETMCGLAEVQIHLGKLDEADASCKKVQQKLDSKDTRRVPGLLGLLAPKNAGSSDETHRARLMALIDDLNNARAAG